MSVNYNWLAEDREELEFIPNLIHEAAFYTWDHKITSVSLTEELESTQHMEAKEDK